MLNILSASVQFQSGKLSLCRSHLFIQISYFLAVLNGTERACLCAFLFVSFSTTFSRDGQLRLDRLCNWLFRSKHYQVHFYCPPLPSNLRENWRLKFLFNLLFAPDTLFLLLKLVVIYVRRYLEKTELTNFLNPGLIVRWRLKFF